jgi:hypothetical protein
VRACLASGLALWCVSASGLSAQAEGEASLNLLTAPSSPAFVLLGIEPTSIERPGSVTDLALSLRSATDDFGVVPESYALSVAPWWLTPAADDLDYATYAGGQGALLRTATISIATTTETDATSGERTTSLGIGLRVGLAQGPIAQDEDYVTQMEALRDSLDNLVDALAEIQQAKLRTDPELLALEAASDSATVAETQAALDLLIEHRTQVLVEEADAELRQRYDDRIEALRRQSANLPLRRSGFNLDLAGGAVIDFPGREFDRADGRSLGGWLTGSLEYGWGAALGVGRIQKDFVDDVTSVDLGGRLILDNVQGVSLSVEGLGRLFPNVDGRETEWRYSASVDYSVGSNRVVSFAIGRDFEGRRASDLILALSFGFGFGSMRPVL